MILPILRSIGIFGLCFCVCYSAWAIKITEPMDPKSINERIKPIGSVSVVDPSGAAVEASTDAVELGPDTGKKRYDAYCAACHQGGVAGSPKFRDKGAWEPRLAKGIDASTKKAWGGFGAMPPKGTCMDCSEAEFRLAVEYMLPQ